MRKHAALVLQAVGSALLLWWLFRGFDWMAFRTAVARLPLSMYVIAFGVTAAGQVLYALKWFLALRAAGIKVGFGRVLEQYVIGIFFNNFLPSTVGGDWAKVYYLGQHQGYVAVTASVFIDRYLGALYLALFASILLWLPMAPAGPWLLVRATLTAGTTVLVFGAIVAVVLPRGQLAGRLASRDDRIGRGARHVSGFADHVRTMFKHPFVMLGAAVTVAVYFAMQTAVYRWFFADVAATRVAYWPLLAAVIAISALSMIPVAVNGLGLREQLHAVLLASLGVPREAAVAMSLMLFSHLIPLSVIGLVVWLLHRRQVMRHGLAPLA